MPGPCEKGSLHAVIPAWIVGSKKSNAMVGTPLAVTQKDCLVYTLILSSCKALRDKISE